MPRKDGTEEPPLSWWQVMGGLAGRRLLEKARQAAKPFLPSLTSKLHAFILSPIFRVLQI